MEKLRNERLEREKKEREKVDQLLGKKPEVPIEDKQQNNYNSGFASYHGGKVRTGK